MNLDYFERAGIDLTPEQRETIRREICDLYSETAYHLALLIAPSVVETMNKFHVTLEEVRWRWRPTPQEAIAANGIMLAAFVLIVWLAVLL